MHALHARAAQLEIEIPFFLSSQISLDFDQFP